MTSGIENISFWVFLYHFLVNISSGGKTTKNCKYSDIKPWPFKRSNRVFISELFLDLAGDPILVLRVFVQDIGQLPTLFQALCSVCYIQERQCYRWDDLDACSLSRIFQKYKSLHRQNLVFLLFVGVSMSTRFLRQWEARFRPKIKCRIARTYSQTLNISGNAVILNFWINGKLPTAWLLRLYS